MPIKRPVGDVARLIAELGSSDLLRRETAVARLAIIGTRAVTPLTSLAGDVAAPAAARIAALQALEAIGDSRASSVALALLDGSDDSLAIAAIAVLGPVARQRDARGSKALERLTALAMAHDVATDRRLAALGALDELPERLVAPVYQALATDPAPKIAAHATRKQSDASVPLAALLERGLPDDPGLLTAIIREDADDTRASDLRGLVDAIRSRERHAPVDQRASWTTARGLIHQSLAARGSRLALYDLRETMEQAEAPLPVGFLAAAAAIGDASCLESLAAAWTRVDDRWWRDHLSEAFAAIVRRENITRRHPALKKILTRWPAAGVLLAGARRT